MEQKLLATGVEYSLEDCAIVRFIIPPLELKDGTLIKLRDAQAVFPPIKMLVTHGNQLIKAEFDPQEAKWEVIE